MNRRAGHLLRQFQARRAYTVLELILIGLLALAAARLFWAIVTPVGPVGGWESRFQNVVPPPAAVYDFTGLAPVFGMRTDDGPIVVSDLELDLYGVRMDRVSGRGSAIIGGEDEPQRSFAVGDEVISGVTLHEVNMDNVVLLRGGARETLFLDQSQPVRRVGGSQDAGGGEPASESTPVPPSELPPDSEGADAGPVALSQQIGFSPRLVDGRVAGLSVAPRGNGVLFRQSGLQQGDLVTAINGTPLDSAEAAEAALSNVRPGDTIQLSVERGGEPTTLTIRVPSE